MNGLPRQISVMALLAALFVSACADSEVVHLPDCIDCRPVEMSLDKTLEIDLGTDRAVTNDPDLYTWVVTETGTMTLASEDRGTRSEGDEFVGGYSRYVTYSFAPTVLGTTELHFEFAPSDGGEPGTALEITVIVSE